MNAKRLRDVLGPLIEVVRNMDTPTHPARLTLNLGYLLSLICVAGSTHEMKVATPCHLSLL